MSTVEYQFGTNGFEAPLIPSGATPITPPPQPSSRVFHRIQEVCRQQGTTIRALTRKMELSASDIRHQCDPQSDLRISDLMQWQQVLEVPLSELLIDSDGPLSDPVKRRACLLRVMKTAKAILESAHDRSVKRMATMLVNQLVELMPELAEVSAWHSVGQRRTQGELGRIVERSIPDNFFSDVNRSA